jgi:chloramphenicol O-acetyltransferase
LRQLNCSGSVLLSPAHFLFKNVAQAMQLHREFNCRVARKHVYEYKQVNLLVPIYNKGGSEINTLLLEDVPNLSLEQIARFMWLQANAAARGNFEAVQQPSWLERLPRFLVLCGMWLYLWIFNEYNFPKLSVLRRENVASMLVNYFGARNSPPLKSYKPSRFPLDGLPFSITMGATRDEPVVDNGKVVPGRVAPLYLRADHRLVDAYLMKAFLETLLKGFAQPALIEPVTAIESQRTA